MKEADQSSRSPFQPPAEPSRGRLSRRRFLKLVAVSSFEPAKPYASLAELSVITDK